MARGQDKHLKHTTKQYTKPKKVISALRAGLCGYLSSQSLGRYWQLNQNNHEIQQTQKLTEQKSGTSKQQKKHIQKTIR